ncbi:MAG: DUF6252 family protein [Flavobacteriales bacterium]
MLLASCDPVENEENETAIVPVQAVTASIGGQLFTAASITHEVLDGIHVFICTSATLDVLTIKISDLAVGDHAINFDDPTITYYTGGNLFDQTPMATGTINISEQTAYRINGSFETVVRDIAVSGQELTVTGGLFTQLEY